MFRGCDSPVRIVQNPCGFRVVNEAFDVTVKLGDDEVADFGVATDLLAQYRPGTQRYILLLQQLGNQEFGVFSLCQ